MADAETQCLSAVSAWQQQQHQQQQHQQRQHMCLSTVDVIGFPVTFCCCYLLFSLFVVIRVVAMVVLLLLYALRVHG